MEQTKIIFEDEISRILLSDNGCTAHFEYKHDYIGYKNLDGQPSGKSKEGAIIKSGDPILRIVTVLTYNPKTKETFLLKTVTAKTDEEGLQLILAYAKNHKTDYDSFTVVWAKKSETKQEKSYFYCKDLLEALEKFYHNKNREDYVVYETKMNPKS